MRILLVEDNPGDANLIREMLPESGGVSFEVECLPRLFSAIGRLKYGGIDLVLLDLDLPDSDGLDSFHRVRDAAPNAPIVVMTGNADEKTATAAVRAGAQDYLVKGQVSGDLLARSIRYAVARKRTERELREKETLLKQTFSSIQDGVSILGMDLSILRVNSAMEKWYAHAMPLIGKQCYQAYHGRSDRCEDCPSARTIKTGKSDYSIVPKRGAHGEIAGWQDLFSFPLLDDETGQMRGVVEYVRDITDRKRAEEALQDALSEWRTTFDAIRDSICLIDNKGTIIRHNKATELLLGKPSSEISGRSCWEVFHGLSAPIDDCPVVRMWKSLRRETLVIQEGDRWLEVTTDPLLDTGGNLKGGVHVATDITSRKRMEEEILKSQKLESLSVMAGGIAHDFNNILAGILGNVSFARMLLQTNPAKAADRLVEAEQASLRARDLTQQLLTFAKGGAPVRATRDMGSLLQESVQFATRGSNVAARFEIAPDLWPAEVDEGQINQVVGNLVLNAVQAMPTGGTIAVRADNVVVQEGEVPILKSGRYIRVSIQDKGAGIPAHLLGKIFDPFFTTRQQRSGLGLPTVYSIVRNHDGHVTVESTPGVGSVFTIHLPASEQVVARTAATAAGIEHFNARVLVMDDEPMVCDLVTEVLREKGCNIGCAMDGREMLQLYREAKDKGEPFDLVIMDLTIPGGMGGKEAIKELLALDPGAKAIVSSGYSNDPIMAEYREYGFAAVLAKPYQINEISEVLRKVLDIK